MSGPEEAIDFFHGYTYSGHPVACAASIATLEVYKEEGLLTRAAELAPYWQEAVHSLKGLPHVIDIRNIGLIGAVEFEPDSRSAGQARAYALRRGLQSRPPGPRDRRHHRALAAAHHREEGDRPADRYPLRRAQDRRTERRYAMHGHHSERHRRPQGHVAVAAHRARLQSRDRRADGRTAALDRRRGECRRRRRQEGGSRLGHDAAAQAHQAHVPLQGAAGSQRRRDRAHHLAASTARPTKMRAANSPAASTWSISPAAFRIC